MNMDPTTLTMLMQGLGSQKNGGYGSPIGGGIMQFLGGLFGHSDDPYKEAQKAYQQYFNQATNAQQPYTEAGQNALGKYQNWLQGQQNPSDFINNLMNQYQESPWAKYSQQQSIRAGQNAASAGGLSNGMGGAGLGSTPFAQQLQQNAQGISSQDMQNWLGNVLGINTNYGQGLQNLIGGGQNAANSLSNLYNTGGENMAGFAYGKQAGQNQDFSNILGGLGHLFFG